MINHLRRCSCRSSCYLLRRYESTFVSKHFTVDPKEIKGVLDNMSSRYRRSNGHYEVQVCSLCDKGNKQKEDNMWKLYVHDDGRYHCFRCSKGGTWFDLKRRVSNGGSDHSSNIDIIPVKDHSKTTPVVIGKEKTSHMIKQLYAPDEGPKKVLDYLLIARGLSKVIIQRYGVGFATEKWRDDNGEYVDHLSMSFPWMDEQIPDSDKNKKSSSKSDSNTQMQRNLLSAVSPTSSGGGCNSNSSSGSDGSSTSGESEDGSYVPRSSSTEQEQQQSCEGSLTLTEGDSDNSEDGASGEYEGAADSEDKGAGGEVDREDGDGSQETTDEPAHRPKFTTVRIKYRALDGKGKQRLFPKGGPWGFFGWHTVRPADTEIVITEGEFDAMAVAQVTSKLKMTHPLHKLPAISLPNGASSLPPELLPRLERFTKIYLWMDDDGPGIVAAEKFSRKLGLRRCVVVKPLSQDESPPKDANDALRSEKGAQLIVEMLQSASPLRHERLSTFKDLRAAALAYLTRPDGYALGTPTPSLPRLTSITKGFRAGELVVFTGPTGAGKTTLLSQLTLDFSKKGAATLWGSFEIQNIQLITKMLQQNSKDARVSSLSSEKLNLLADQFESLPLVFMNFHGGSDLPEILDAMEYAVYQYDIKHIVLDNLQFMMPRTTRRGGFDKFENQDFIVDEFRKFATEKLVNIILVIHPRKEDSRFPLHMASIFGTAKATQEADIVMILQRVEGEHSEIQETRIDIRKNRYDGQLGTVKVDFNPSTSCFYQLDKK